MTKLTPWLRLPFSLVILLASVWPPGQVAPISAGPSTQAAPPADLQAFQLVAPERGWLLLDQRLYWTDDNGAQWRDITPPEIGAANIAAAHFEATRHGWLVTIAGPESTDPAYHLFRTADGGATWRGAALDLFAPGEAAAVSSAVYLEFIDASTGWLVVKQATSSAFSLGTLFRTTDGGEKWTRLPLPAGGPVRFSTPQTGVLEAGPPAPGRYATVDGGETWELQATEALTPSPLEGVSEVSLATTEAGWGRSAVGQCDEDGCMLAVQLVTTRDGGRAWAPVPLPNGQTTLERTYTAPAAGAAVEATLNENGLALNYTGHGFDACPGVGQNLTNFLAGMPTWFASSPYRVWNLYIGGTSVANCGALTAGIVHDLAQQGWHFIPTWVGPQAPCSGFSRKMSGDPATAFQQGVIEAHLAMDRAAVLRLAVPGQQSTAIYYDLEAYGVQPPDACREAVKAFISGWTATLRAKGHLSGVYGSPCGSYMNDLAGIANVPDMVWLAYWTRSFHDPSIEVWGLPCVSDSLWTQNQRLRQYTGGHSEPWGGVTFNIDSNVLAGVVTTASSSCLPAAGQAALFALPNYGGQCVLRGLGDYASHASLGVLGDQASSVRVGANTRLTVCEHTNFAGACQDFIVSNPNLADDAIGDNTVSSIRVKPHTPTLTKRAWLPLFHVSPVITSGLPNGHFENGPALWGTSSALGLNVIVPNPTLQAAGVTAHGGSWAAWLGGAHSENGLLEQTVAVPPDAPLLSYWQWVKSTETGCYYDVVSVWVNGSVLDSYGLCGDSGGWLPQWVDLSAYRGSVVNLRFQVTTDTSLVSSVFIDDVTWRSRP